MLSTVFLSNLSDLWQLFSGNPWLWSLDSKDCKGPYLWARTTSGQPLQSKKYNLHLLPPMSILLDLFSLIPSAQPLQCWSQPNTCFPPWRYQKRSTNTIYLSFVPRELAATPRRTQIGSSAPVSKSVPRRVHWCKSHTLWHHVTDDPLLENLKLLV